MSYPVQYYDLVLLAIAGSVVAGVIVGLLTSISLTVAVPTLSVVALTIMLHALFVNGPVEELDDLADRVDPHEMPVVGRVAGLDT